MKILITGQSSYLGNQLKEALKKGQDVEMISLREDGWKNRSFSDVSTLIHCAGIAHSNEDIKPSVYDQVNHLLTYELALKAKKDQVPHFIFLSSILVYGNEHLNALSLNTPLSPKSAYAKSKMDAESALMKLDSPSFKVSILRLPMVYGKDSIGNFKRLLKLAKISPLFPSYPNQRSFLSTENFQLIVSNIIKTPQSKIYLIADKTPISTSSFYRLIRLSLDKNTLLIPFSFFINQFKKISGAFSKVFGSLYYDSNDLYQEIETLSTEASLRKIQGKSL